MLNNTAFRPSGWANMQTLGEQHWDESQAEGWAEADMVSGGDVWHF